MKRTEGNTAFTLPEMPNDDTAQVSTALTIVDKAKALAVLTPQDLELARDVVRQINERIKWAKDHHKDIKETAFAAHKAAVAAEKKVLDPLEQAKAIITGTANDYLREQERLAEIERKKEEERLAKERDRKLKAAEKKMETLLGKAGDDAGKLDALRQQIDSGELSPEEEHVMRGQVMVIEARIAGNQARADQIERDAQAVYHAPVAAVTPAASVPKTSGVVTRTKKVVRIVSPKVLLMAVMENRIPLGVIKGFDMKVLETLAEAGMELPGCSVTEESSSHFR